jgi:hypothetical protein
VGPNSLKFQPIRFESRLSPDSHRHRWFQSESLAHVTGLKPSTVHRIALKTIVNLESIGAFTHIEVNEMSKSQDAKKDKKKQPQKSAKEKRQAKREKRNK